MSERETSQNMGTGELLGEREIIKQALERLRQAAKHNVKRVETRRKKILSEVKSAEKRIARWSAYETRFKKIWGDEARSKDITKGLNNAQREYEDLQRRLKKIEVYQRNCEDIYFNKHKDQAVAIALQVFFNTVASEDSESKKRRIQLGSEDWADAWVFAQKRYQATERKPDLAEQEGDIGDDEVVEDSEKL